MRARSFRFALVACVAVAILTTACAPAKPAANVADSGQQGPDLSGQIVPGPGETTPAPQTADIAFNLAVSFSDAAKAKIAGLNERVIVNAMYYGEPMEGVETEPGGFNLGEEVQEIMAEDQTVPFTGTYRTDVGAGQMVGAPRVLVNVYTARKVAEDNLLDCGILDDALPNAATYVGQIQCKLIEEP